YGPPPFFDSNNLTGPGFNNGTLILTAVPQASPGGIGDFTSSGALGLYDQFGADNYAGKQSVVGSGGERADFHVTSTNPAFFITSPGSLLAFRSDAQAPFFANDPSMLFPGL